MPLNFRQFEALYWIARLGSFHAAARHIGTSQPAISKRVRDMEEQLGVNLIDRSERQMRLTAKGQELLQYATRIMAISSEIQQRVGTSAAITGRVRLGVTGIPALTWLPVLLERVARTTPGVVVEFTVDTSETLHRQIERGRLDVAVLAGPVAMAKLRTEALGRVPMAWLASPKLELPVNPLSAADLALWPVITDRDGSHLHAAAMEWFRADGVEPARHHGCANLSTRIQLAVEGLGVALASAVAATRELTQGSLLVVQTRRTPPHLDYVIAYPDISPSSAVRMVAGMVKTLIEQKPDLQSYYAAMA